MTDADCMDLQDAVDWLFSQSLGELSLCLRNGVSSSDDLEANALIDAVVNFRLSGNV